MSKTKNTPTANSRNLVVAAHECPCSLFETSTHDVDSAFSQPRYAGGHSATLPWPASEHEATSKARGQPAAALALFVSFAVSSFSHCGSALVRMARAQEGNYDFADPPSFRKDVRSYCLFYRPLKKLKAVESIRPLSQTAKHLRSLKLLIKSNWSLVFITLVLVP